MTRFPSLCRYRCGFLYDRQTIEPTAYKRSTMFSQILTRSHKLYGTAIASAAPEASLATNQWIVSRVRHSLGCFFFCSLSPLIRGHHKYGHIVIDRHHISLVLQTVGSQSVASSGRKLTSECLDISLTPFHVCDPYRCTDSRPLEDGGKRGNRCVFQLRRDLDYVRFEARLPNSPFKASPSRVTEETRNRSSWWMVGCQRSV
jgi:hypothetical protein